MDHCLYQVPSKVDGQGSRETTSASQEIQAEMREGVVKFSTEDVVAWCMPWQNLYIAVTQVEHPYAWQSST